MKTGFSLIEPTKPDPVLLNTLNNLLLIFSEKSIMLGAHYAKSAGRTNLSGMDTIYALQYLAHEFMDLEDLPRLLHDCNGDDDCSDSDSDDDCIDSDDDSDDDSGDCDEFTRATDEDSVCKKMNHYHDTWSEWIPTDDIEIMLKRNIDKTLQSV